MELSERYYDALCEQEQVLQENHGHLLSVIGILKSLNEEVGDEELLVRLGKLSRSLKELVDSSVELRYRKYQARELRVTMDALGPEDNDEVVKAVQRNEKLREYIDLIEAINRDSLTYVNMLGRLSVDLAKQIELSDNSVTEFVVSEWKPPQEVQEILEKFLDLDDSTRNLDEQLDKYLDGIKMERAKYSLENKYALQEQLKTLEKEVSHWREAWVDIEKLMFGDSAQSMKGMLRSIEKMQTKLTDTEKLQLRADEDVVMQ
ncbi:Thp2p [Nakaseomyces bracarensis]|uniref:Thp2p n=1 Tax=Nakaseomyces bracarensis TaxID=273131 RepID=UPI0038719F85